MSTRSISDLKNYQSVLQDLSHDDAVHLSENGVDKYVILKTSDYNSYIKNKAALKLLLDLSQAEKSGYLSAQQVKQHFKDKIKNAS